MKPLKTRILKTAVVVIVMASTGALAQGTVNFSNTPSQIGGTQGRIFDTDRTTPLDGADYFAQLYMGPHGGSLTPQGAAVNFLSGAGAGYFNGGSVTVDNVAPGAEGVAEVRVWAAAGGNSWEEALGAGQPVGQTSQFQQLTGGVGAPPSLPENMVNMTGSILPEPSASSLGILGAIALMLRRRR